MTEGESFEARMKERQGHRALINLLIARNNKLYAWLVVCGIVLVLLFGACLYALLTLNDCH